MQDPPGPLPTVQVQLDIQLRRAQQSRLFFRTLVCGRCWLIGILLSLSGGEPRSEVHCAR